MSTYYIANMFCSFTQNEVKKKRYWKVGFRFFGCYFAIANRRLKIRPVNDDRCRNPKDEHIFKKIKHTIYDEQGGYALCVSSTSSIRIWSATIYSLGAGQRTYDWISAIQ